MLLNKSIVIFRLVTQGPTVIKSERQTTKTTEAAFGTSLPLDLGTANQEFIKLYLTY